MKKEKVLDNRLLTRAEVAELFHVDPSAIPLGRGGQIAWSSLGGHPAMRLKRC
jgi:hypothetical protein